MKKEKKKIKIRMVPGTNVPYENWIQGWIISNQLKRKIDWFNIFVLLVGMPSMIFFSWYGIYKLVMWMMYG
jgi:hypothetical protein